MGLSLGLRLGLSSPSTGGGAGPARPQVVLFMDNSQLDAPSGTGAELTARNAYNAAAVANPNIVAWTATETFSAYLPGTMTGRKANARTAVTTTGYELGIWEGFAAAYPGQKLWMGKFGEAGSAGGLNSTPGSRGSFVAGIVAGASAISSLTSGTPVVNRHIIAPGLEDSIIMTNSGSPPMSIRKMGIVGTYPHPGAVPAPTTFEMYSSLAWSKAHGSLYQGAATNLVAAVRTSIPLMMAAIQAETGLLPEVRMVTLPGPGNDADYADSAPLYQAGVQELIAMAAADLAPWITDRTVYAMRKMPRSTLGAGAQYDRETTVIAAQVALKAANPRLRLVYAGVDGPDVTQRFDGTHDSLSQIRTVTGPGMFAVGFQGGAGV